MVILRSLVLSPMPQTNIFSVLAGQLIGLYMCVSCEVIHLNLTFPVNSVLLRDSQGFGVIITAQQT